MLKKEKKMNIKEEIDNLKKFIGIHEKRLAKLEQQLLESESRFEIAPKLLEKENVNWNEAVKYCELLGNGWRLPSKDELKIILTLENDLNTNYRYWSTATRGNKDLIAFNQSLYRGYRVRPIRDIIKPKSCLPFEVADKSTENRLSWNEAVKYVKTLGKGWRLPTKHELTLIYISDNDFDKEYYWSSTEFNSTDAWGKVFDGGYETTSNKAGSNYVRAIRPIL
jgi:hypothetical protein